MTYWMWNGAFALRAQAHRLFYESALPDGRGVGIHRIDLTIRVLFHDVRRGVLCSLRRCGKPARKTEMQDIFRALFRKFLKMQEVVVVIEHGRARKAALPELPVKIDVPRIIGQGIFAFGKPPALFHGISQRHDADIVFLYVIAVKVACGIAGDDKIFHVFFTSSARGVAPPFRGAPAVLFFTKSARRPPFAADRIFSSG